MIRSRFIGAAALSIILGVAALPATAACTGPSLLDRLTEAELQALAETTAATPYGEGILWQAERDGVRMVIAGTIHIPDPRIDAIADRIDEEVAQADLVLLEMTPAEETEMQAAMAERPDRMFITEGPTLPEILDEETWQAVSDAVRARGIPPFVAAKFRPWYLMVSLSIPVCAGPEMASGERGLDHLVMDIAAQAGVEMQSLEDWDTLLETLQGGTEAEQIELLRMSLIAPELQEEMLVALVDGYFAGRIAEVWELSRLSTNYVPGIDPADAMRLQDMMQERLLTDRNHKWIPVIEAAAASHDAIVIAAGAAHLPGEEGILSLLADRGWRITPFNPE